MILLGFIIGFTTNYVFNKKLINELKEDLQKLHDQIKKLKE